MPIWIRLSHRHSWELAEEQWDAVIDINLKGGWLASKYAIPHLIEQRSGVIIYNSSIGELEGKTPPEEIAEACAGNLLPVPWIETKDVVAAVEYLIWPLNQGGTSPAVVSCSMLVC